MRKLIAAIVRPLRALLVVIILLFMPTNARSEMPVVYDVIVKRERLSDGIGFSSPSVWAELSQVTGVAGCYSCFGAALFMSPERLRVAKRAVMYFGFNTNYDTTQIRLVSFYVDGNGQRVYNRSWPIAMKSPCCNPSAVFFNVTSQWNAYFASLPIMSGGVTGLSGVSFFVEVIGSGSVLMAQIVVDY